MHRSFAFLLAAGLASPLAAHAAESYDNCAGFIDALPATLTTQGVWCLRKDLNFAATLGDAIRINANNVTIDCNDFKIGGLSAGPGTTALGITAVERHNATVRNCSIRGFYRGVSLSGIEGGGHLVADNRLDGNTYNGIRVDGDGSMVRRNVVTATGGSTHIAKAIGISVNGSVDVLDNLVTGVHVDPAGAGAVTGIFAAGTPAGSVNGNRVLELAVGEVGSIEGIRVNGGHAIVRGNQLDGDSGAGTGTGTGLNCDDDSTRAKDNSVIGFATALLGCGNAGGNDLQP